MINITTENDMRLDAIIDILISRAGKQGIDPRAFDVSKEHYASGPMVKKDFPLTLILALKDVSPKTWELGPCTDWKACIAPEFEHPWLSSFGVIVTGLCLLLTFKVISKLRYKYPIRIIDSARS